MPGPGSHPRGFCRGCPAPGTSVTWQCSVILTLATKPYGSELMKVVTDRQNIYLQPDVTMPHVGHLPQRSFPVQRCGAGSVGVLVALYTLQKV